MPPDNVTANPYAAPAFHPEDAAPLAGKYTFVKNPSRLTKTLIGSLILFLLVELLGFIWNMIPFSPAERSYSEVELDRISAINNMLMIVHPVVSFVTFITFGRWIYRAGVNSRGFGAQGMRVSPGWAIGWYFIPIMNFFRPYQAMKEIWQVSGNPGDWKNQGGSPILVCWWSLCVLINIHGFIASRFPYDWQAYFDFFQQSVLGAIVGTGTSSAVTIAAILLVRAITRRQEALVSRNVA